MPRDRVRVLPPAPVSYTTLTSATSRPLAVHRLQSAIAKGYFYSILLSMTMLGRLLHYTFDAVLVSTVLAGVRRSSGFSPDSTAIGDSTLRSVADRFLGVGESVFDVVQGTVVTSSYFKRGGRDGS